MNADHLPTQNLRGLGWLEQGQYIMLQIRMRHR